MRGIPPAGARVLVTGAGSGIGAATAVRYAAAGADVIAVDIDAEGAERTAARCHERGPGRHLGYTCDVADAGAMEGLARRLAEGGTPIEVLVNNAGVGVGGPFLRSSLADWEWIRGVNLDGIVNGVRAFVPAMIEARRGHVVNVASGASYVASRHLAAYCGTKAAVLHMSRCWRGEWRSSGVGVSAICPGFTNTPIMSAGRVAGVGERELRLFERALRRGHPPDAVARAIVGAAERDRFLVPVGFESRLAYQALRFLPSRAQDLLASA